MRAVVAWWKWLAGAAVGLLLLYLALSSVQTIAWVGSKDLEVEFVIADAGTGRPVPGAAVQFYNPHPSSLCGEEYREAEFRRSADEGGRVRLLCRQCMCSGHKNWYEDTFSIHLPEWYFVVTAAVGLSAAVQLGRQLEANAVDVRDLARRLGDAGAEGNPSIRPGPE